MTLYVNKVGRGSKIVFLHGWGFNSAVWHQAVDKLQYQFEVTVIDLPGFGYSANDEGDFCFDDVVQRVADAIDDNVILVGWSMGGIIAQKIASDYPRKVAKLVLLACNAQFVADSAWPYGIDANVLTSFSESLLKDYKKTLHRFLLLQARGDENMRETVKELKQRLFEHGEPKSNALSGGLRLLQSESFVDDLANIVQPVLIAQGRLDTLVPHSSGTEMLLKIPDGKLYLFEQAAHAPFISHLEEFVTVLDDFVNVT